MSKLLALAGAAVVALASTSAQAVPYLFTLTGATTATFTLDSNPTVSSFGSGSFVIENVPGYYYDGAKTSALQDIQFYTAATRGGFTIFNNDYYDDLYGPQVFSGPTKEPTFNLGSYDLPVGASNSTSFDHLVISDASAAVPEPASWAMFIGGFGAIGFGLRRRRTSVGLA